MNRWIKDFWVKMVGRAPTIKAGPTLDWKSLSQEQQREEITKLYAMAVCHKDNLPWYDAMDKCMMMGQCERCRKIADAFVDVEQVMRSEIMR